MDLALKNHLAVEDFFLQNRVNRRIVDQKKEEAITVQTKVIEVKVVNVYFTGNAQEDIPEVSQETIEGIERVTNEGIDEIEKEIIVIVHLELV